MGLRLMGYIYGGTIRERYQSRIMTLRQRMKEREILCCILFNLLLNYLWPSIMIPTLENPFTQTSILRHLPLPM